MPTWISKLNVDGTIRDIRDNTIQLREMPAASENYLGRIVQYIGNTTSIYTHGYFYECTSTGTPALYSWEQVCIQSKSDLTSISITGTTNNTGSTISSGTYFYLNGTLVKAKNSIANGTILTKNTNYVEINVGSINDLYYFLGGYTFPFKEYAGTSTTFTGIDGGLWFLSGSAVLTMTDAPSNFTGGRAFVIKTKISDEELLILFAPKSNKVWIKMQYVAWSNWFEIQMSALT